jgi:hypothetical protein
MSHSLFLAVLGPAGGGAPTEGPKKRKKGEGAAVRVHGVYDTIRQARAAAQALAAEDKETDAYVIEETMRWIAVKPPARGTADEEEEVASRTNEAHADGRMGSVCDILRRPTVSDDRVTLSDKGETAVEDGDRGTPAPGTAAAALAVGPGAAVSASGATTCQKRQLDDLLRRDVPSSVWEVPRGGEEEDADEAVGPAAQYANMRAWYATLVAFRRKILRLRGLVEEKCVRAESEIADLGARHPGHRTAFRAHYEQGLRESGLTLATVPFLPFLGDESF